MNPLDVIHRIEDLQVVGFAAVFGIMAFQSRRNRVLRYLLLSYALGSVVSFMDVLHTGMSPRVQMMASLALISLRYGFMTRALSLFTRSRRWFARLSFAAAMLPVADVAFAATHLGSPTPLVLTYSAMAFQYALIAAMLLTRLEKATRVPRRTLAALFLVSVFIRCVLIAAVVWPAHGVVWLRDQLWFINSAVVGCITPFTIIWMMNSRVYDELRRQSLMDPLTGLLNRRGLQQAVSREMARYGRNRQDFAVAVADIDHFKSLNDAYGHTCGDLVLQQFGDICRRILRQSDVVARTGGEEFTFLLPISTDSEMRLVLERVRTQLQDTGISSGAGDTVFSTISIGVTNTSGRAEVTWDQLLREADEALYQAKRAGRNRTQTVSREVAVAESELLEETLPVA